MRGLAVRNPDNSDASDDINEPNPHETKDGHPDDNEAPDVTNDPYKSMYTTKTLQDHTKLTHLNRSSSDL